MTIPAKYRGPFGGDTRKSHWCARIEIDKDADRKTRSEQYRERKRVLAEAGFKAETYFEFFDKDKSGSSRAEGHARAHASLVEQRTGVRLVVNEGCFL